jgi:hypothetical protein
MTHPAGALQTFYIIKLVGAAVSRIGGLPPVQILPRYSSFTHPHTRQVCFLHLLTHAHSFSRYTSFTHLLARTHSADILPSFTLQIYFLHLLTHFADILPGPTYSSLTQQIYFLHPLTKAYSLRGYISFTHSADIRPSLIYSCPVTQHIYISFTHSATILLSVTDSRTLTQQLYSLHALTHTHSLGRYTSFTE